MHDSTIPAGAAPVQAVPGHAARCEDRHAPLQGQYCPACGPSRHDPAALAGISS